MIISPKGQRTLLPNLLCTSPCTVPPTKRFFKFFCVRKLTRVWFNPDIEPTSLVVTHQHPWAVLIRGHYFEPTSTREINICGVV